MKYLNNCIEIIIKNTSLNKEKAISNLINIESNIQYEQLYKNYCKFNQSYFYLATSKIIRKYK